MLIDAAGLRAYIGAKLRFSREQPWASRVYALEVINGAPLYGAQIRDRVVPLLRKDIAVFEAWIAACVAMIVAMLGVYLCKALGLTGPAILIGAVAGVVCALAFSALFPRRPVTASAPGTDPVGGDLGRPSSSGDSSPDEGGERR